MIKSPWQVGPLTEWSIVGMNHYYVNGEKRLFVAMINGDHCIKEEGIEDEYLWNRLCHKAWKVSDNKSLNQAGAG